MAGTGNAGVGAVIPRMPTSGRRALRMVSAGHAGDIGHQGCRNARRAGAWNSRFCIPFLQIRKISQIYYFKLVPGDFTDLQQTLHTASVDTPVIKLSKKFSQHSLTKYSLIITTFLLNVFHGLISVNRPNGGAFIAK